MRRWMGIACLAALISGCAAESSMEPSSATTSVVSPDATADQPEAPDASDVTYVEWRGTGFTVIKSATADALFESVASCTSEEGGYAVEYPVSWHTNEGGEAPGCSWFGPQPFAHAPAALVAVRRPLNVPIQLGVLSAGHAQVGGGPRPPLDDQVVIGGVEGYRTEAEIRAEPPWWSYVYKALLDPAFDSLTFMAETTSAWEDERRDYVLNKAVLDRMMASLEFTDGGPPPPVALPTPSATYVERPGYRFTVIESAGADVLFQTPDTCTNPVAGYTVTFPDDWYTNTEIGDWPPCTWFSPSYYEVGEDPNEVPPEIAIVLRFGDMSFGYTGTPHFSVFDRLTIDRFEATRAELIGHTVESGITSPISPMYWYIVTIEERPGDEPTVYARTDFEGAADYELNKAVLDRIMALIEFEN